MTLANPIRINLWYVLFLIGLVGVGGFILSMKVIDLYDVYESATQATAIRTAADAVIKNILTGAGILLALIPPLTGIAMKLADEKPETPTVPLEAYMELAAILRELEHGKDRKAHDTIAAIAATYGDRAT